MTVVSCVWADRIRWRAISWDIMRGIGWEEGEGRNNGGIGKLCARASASRREEVDKRAGRGGGGRSGEGEEAFHAVHPFRCHSMLTCQRYVPFVSKDEKQIFLQVNLFFISIMHLHPT